MAAAENDALDNAVKTRLPEFIQCTFGFGHLAQWSLETPL